MSNCDSNNNNNNRNTNDKAINNPRCLPRRKYLPKQWLQLIDNLACTLKIFATEKNRHDDDVNIKDVVNRSESKCYFKRKKDHVQDEEVEKCRKSNDIMIEHIRLEKDHYRTAEEELKLGIIDFAAGSIGGLVQVLVSQPFDTIKVKQQMFPKLYKNMFTCFKLIYKRDGIIHGLFAGTKPAVLASIAENSVLFAAYGRCQNLVANIMEINDVEDLSVLGNATAGFITAFFSSFTLCPTELIKCKLQSVTEMKQFVSKDGKVQVFSAWHIAQDILKTEGVSGLYRGLTSTFTREMPGLFCFFGGYEGTRTYFTQPGQSKDDIGALKTMLAGVIGGLSLWIITFPIDVIKTRIQVNNLKMSMIAVALEIWRKEGILALYRGLLSSVLRTIPASATLFWVYEYSKKVMISIAGVQK